LQGSAPSLERYGGQHHIQPDLLTVEPPENPLEAMGAFRSAIPIIRFAFSEGQSSRLADVSEACRSIASAENGICRVTRDAQGRVVAVDAAAVPNEQVRVVGLFED
jgi:hypothetical protein